MEEIKNWWGGFRLFCGVAMLSSPLERLCQRQGCCRGDMDAAAPALACARASGEDGGMRRSEARGEVRQARRRLWVTIANLNSFNSYRGFLPIKKNHTFFATEISDCNTTFNLLDRMIVRNCMATYRILSIVMLGVFFCTFRFTPCYSHFSRMWAWVSSFWAQSESCIKTT